MTPTPVSTAGAPAVSARIAEHAADARGALGRIRAVWPLLGEARWPGRAGAHSMLERRLSERAERVEAEQVRRDRRAKHLALRAGKIPLAPYAAPVRLGPVRARARIATGLRIVGAHVGARLPAPLADPTLPQPACLGCAGTGRACPGCGTVCGMCGGFGRRCPVCGTAGGCFCDLADVVVGAGLDALAAALRAARDERVVEQAAAALNSAADLACHTLGIRDIDLRVIKAPCPACGRRDLWADVASPNPDEWSVSCRAALCCCSGPGCGCGRPTRWRGRRHRWPSQEFHALAARLGVPLPIH